MHLICKDCQPVLNNFKVVMKDANIPKDVETCITNTIITESFENSGNYSKMAKAITDILQFRFGGEWNAIIQKSGCVYGGYSILKTNNTCIEVAYEGYHFLIYES